MMPAIKKAFDLVGGDIVELCTENESLKIKIGSYDEKRLEESKSKLLKQIDDGKRASLIMSMMKNRWRNTKQMAYIAYNKLWESEFDNIVFKKR